MKIRNRFSPKTAKVLAAVILISIFMVGWIITTAAVAFAFDWHNPFGLGHAALELLLGLMIWFCVILILMLIIGSIIELKRNIDTRHIEVLKSQWVIAWKRTYLFVQRDGTLSFKAAIAKHTFYTVHADATCVWSSQDGVPHFSLKNLIDDSHRCGFYAFKNRATAFGFMNSYSNLPLARVALSGRILPSTEGFRAAHQRILDLWFDSNCANCATHERIKPASVIVGCEHSGHQYMRGLCETCAQHSCDSPSSMRYTPQQLADILGIQSVRWLDAAGNDQEHTQFVIPNTVEEIPWSN